MLTYEPNSNRTQDEIEEFLVFSVCVAGKNADQTIAKVRLFLEPRGLCSPLEYLEWLGDDLDNEIRKYKLGQYNRIRQAIKGLIGAKLDLRSCSVDDLEAIYGIGPKTARMFVMFTRPGQRYAILDTHILRWLNKLGIEAPRATPSGRKYYELESRFLEICDEQNKDPSELDYAIWLTERGGNENG